jgi:hypothetical protein
MDHYIRFRNNRYNFEIEAAKCPEVPTLPLAQVSTEANKILEAAGAQACETSASIQQFEAQFKAQSLLGGVAGGVKASNSNTSAIGCEQLTVIANKYNKTVQNVACMLKTSKNVTRTTATGINSIVWEAGGDMDIDCGEKGLNFNQKMKLNIISKINLSNQELTQIANEVNDVVKNVAEAVQESKSGIGATPQGQKAISDTMTNINIVDQKNKIDEQIKELNTSVSGSNTVVIKAGGNVKIRGKGCNVSQDMVIDMVADQLVNDAVTTSLSSLSKTVAETETKLAQKAENKGAEELALKLPDVDGPGAMAYIMIIIIAIVLIGALYMLGSKLGAKALDKMPAQRYYRRK